jgi:hypothetical protein
MHRHALSAVCVLAAAFTTPGPASAINTFNSWNGTQSITPFGCPDTTTYGQIITVKGKTMLSKFSFAWMYDGTNGGSLVARGEVYAWDGTKATGSALWESKPVTFAFTDAVFHIVDFKPGALPLTDGAQYILFASIDRDYAKCTNSYTVAWGAVNDTTYAKGEFRYQNNAGDPSKWTTEAWNGFGLDLAFKAALK